MRTQTVIYDSQDEDEGLSPLNSPAKGGALAVGSLTAEDGKAQQVTDYRSTDPDFFRQVYEEQQESAPAWVLDAMRNAEVHAGGSSGGPGQEESGAKDKNSSSSITDPTLKSAKKRALGKVETKDFGNLTQVTTPSAPRTRKRDVYDFSLSDEEGAAAGPAMSRSNRKGPKTRRKRDQSADDDGANTMFTPQLSAAAAHDTLHLDDESPKASRRKKRKVLQDDGSRHSPDDVDLLAMSGAADMGQPPDEPKGAQNLLGEVIADTRDVQRASNQQQLASFFIEPPDTLTSSQKQQYLRVGGSSELDREGHLPPPHIFTTGKHQGSMYAAGHSELDREEFEHQDLLPEAKPSQTQAPIGTGGTLSTIGYPTPSRFASSVPPLPLLENVDGRSSNAATSSSTARSQLVKTQIPTSSPDELSTHVVGRKTLGKRHMSDVPEEDEATTHDTWDFAKIGRSRRRSGADVGSVSETPAARNKRQKTGEQDGIAHDDSWDSDNIGYQRERYVPRPSRRRVRAVVEDDDELQHPEQSMPDTCPPGDVSRELQEDRKELPVSTGQELPQQDTEGMDGVEGVDPGVWAALPEDIRQELRSQHTSEAPRSRRSGRTGEASSSLQAVQEETRQPKKRGRKKNKQKIEEVPITLEESPAALTEPEAPPSPAPTAAGKKKKKRGRPKKSDVEHRDANVSINEPQSEAVEAPLPNAPAKRGRKKKVVEEVPAPTTDLEASVHGLGEDETIDSVLVPANPPAHATAVSAEAEDRQALQDITNSASNASMAGKADTPGDTAMQEKTGREQEVTPEPKTKGVPKSASTPGQQGKAPLRVGLSKKSRIPSLLKMIRK